MGGKSRSFELHLTKTYDMLLTYEYNKLLKGNSSFSPLFDKPLIGLVVLIRIASAIYNIINDCDETYNYWEPSHYLIFGNGYQTWEYSPTYAIRSYFYLLIHIWPLYLLRLLIENKLMMFYLLRIFISSLSIYGEIKLYKKWKELTGQNFLFFSWPLPALFISCSSFLPSSSSMQMIFLSIFSYLSNDHMMFIIYTGISCLIHWPYVVVIGVPMAVYNIRHFKKYILYTTIFCLFTIIPILIDSYFYGRVVVAFWNIVSYNVFNPNTGPELYGVEPWTFYFINSIINCGLLFICYIIWPFVMAMETYLIRGLKNKIPSTKLIYLYSSSFIWFLIMTTQKHKEERFLYPIYPFIIIFSCHTIHSLKNILLVMTKKVWLGPLFLCSVIMINTVISISRILLIINGFQAPINVYSFLYKNAMNLNPNQDKLVCVSEEWHRNPGNFFLPNNFKFGFVKSDFNGILPAYYNESFAKPTRTNGGKFNNLNQEEMDRYVDINECFCLIDLIDPISINKDGEIIKHHKKWTNYYYEDFLIPENSKKLFRSFYIPFLWKNLKYYQFKKYSILIPSRSK